MKYVTFLIIIIIALMYPFSSVAQFCDDDDDNYYHRRHRCHKKPDYVILDGATYTLNYSGIKMMMEDIAISQPEKYALMQKEYDKIKTQYYGAITTFVIGGATSLILISQGTQIRRNYYNGNTLSPGYSSFESFWDETNQSSTYFSAGMSIALVTALVGSIIYPDTNDFLNLVNKHNHISKDKKIEVKTRLAALPHNAIGLQLAINF